MSAARRVRDGASVAEDGLSSTHVPGARKSHRRAPQAISAYSRTRSRCSPENIAVSSSAICRERGMKPPTWRWRWIA